jgi:HSP20 family molecular chaperone IbpA
MNEMSNIEFIIRGKYNNSEISPSNIPLSLLEDFTSDIYNLLNSIPEITKDDISVSIEKGSFKIKTIIALIAINTIQVDILTLTETKNFNTINKKRSDIFENWINKSKAQNTLEFEIKLNNKKSYIFNSKTEIIRNVNEIWSNSELYVYGELIDIGGASSSNMHIRQDDGKILVINCTKNDLEKQKENRIYQNVAIRVKADQNIKTGEIKNLFFVEFIDYNPEYNEEEFLKLVEKGKNSWKDIDNHIDWIRKLRSNDE